MTTIAGPRVKQAEGERRFVIYNAGWRRYQGLLDLFGDDAPRMTYDRGNVELITTYSFHEHLKGLLGYIVEAITDELDMPRFSIGSTTFRSEILDRGLEADECYYLANAHRVRDVKQVDITIDPPPDLAIEVEITSAILDKLGVYAALGFPEIWKHDGEILTVLLLRPDGTYAPSETSAAFPFLPMDEIARFLKEYEPSNDTRWGRAFRSWVRDEIVPRVRDEAGAG